MDYDEINEKSTSHILKSLHSAAAFGDANPNASLSLASTLMLESSKISSSYATGVDQLLKVICKELADEKQILSADMTPAFLRKAIDVVKKQKALNELHSEIINLLTPSSSESGLIVANVSQAQEYSLWDDVDSDE